MSFIDKMKEKVSRVFAVAGERDAVPEISDTVFIRSLAWDLDESTVQNVRDVFKNIGLPPPESGKEYMRGSLEYLVFINRYGLVLRVERKDARSEGDYQILDEAMPWVSKPLLSVDAGAAVVTLCPACPVGGGAEQRQFLKDILAVKDIKFWDDQIVNFGRMPVQTPLFPLGIPVVIDRGAVKALSKETAKIKKALEQANLMSERSAETFTEHAAEAEERLYGPLRRAIEEAWPDHAVPADAKKIKAFLDLCATYVREGKLVAGWKRPDFEEEKTTQAYWAAEAYEKRICSAEKQATLSSAAPYKI